MSIEGAVAIKNRRCTVCERQEIQKHYDFFFLTFLDFDTENCLYILTVWPIQLKFEIQISGVIILQTKRRISYQKIRPSTIKLVIKFLCQLDLANAHKYSHEVLWCAHFLRFSDF